MSENSNQQSQGNHKETAPHGSSSLTGDDLTMLNQTSQSALDDSESLLSVTAKKTSNSDDDGNTELDIAENGEDAATPGKKQTEDRNDEDKLQSEMAKVLIAKWLLPKAKKKGSDGEDYSLTDGLSEDTDEPRYPAQTPGDDGHNTVNHSGDNDTIDGEEEGGTRKKRGSAALRASALTAKGSLLVAGSTVSRSSVLAKKAFVSGVALSSELTEHAAPLAGIGNFATENVRNLSNVTKPGMFVKGVVRNFSIAGKDTILDSIAPEVKEATSPFSGALVVPGGPRTAGKAKQELGVARRNAKQALSAVKTAIALAKAVKLMAVAIKTVAVVTKVIVVAAYKAIVAMVSKVATIAVAKVIAALTVVGLLVVAAVMIASVISFLFGGDSHVLVLNVRYVIQLDAEVNRQITDAELAAYRVTYVHSIHSEYHDVRLHTNLLHFLILYKLYHEDVWEYLESGGVLRVSQTVRILHEKLYSLDFVWYTVLVPELYEYIDEDGNPQSEIVYVERPAVEIHFDVYPIEMVFEKLGLPEWAIEEFWWFVDSETLLENHEELWPYIFASSPAHSGGLPSPEAMQVINETHIEWPTDRRRISSRFGADRWNADGSWRPHMGIDTPMPIGTNVHASISGTVTVSSFSVDSRGIGAGHMIFITSDCGRIVTRYKHLNVRLVSVGQRVFVGDLIARSGNSGTATSPGHLHYEAAVLGQRLDPMHFLPFCDRVHFTDGWGQTNNT